MAIKKTIILKVLYSHKKRNQNRPFKSESTRGKLRRPKSCSIFIKKIAIKIIFSSTEFQHQLASIGSRKNGGKGSGLLKQ